MSEDELGRAIVAPAITPESILDKYQGRLRDIITEVENEPHTGDAQLDAILLVVTCNLLRASIAYVNMAIAQTEWLKELRKET